MKRIICLITALCLIFGSFSFCFAADWSDSDKQNLQNAAGRLYYMNQSAAYYLYNIATNTNNIYNKSVDIYNALFNNGHNITYWIHEIEAWMSPIYNALVQTPIDLAQIIGALGYSENSTYYPYLSLIKDGITNTNNTYYELGIGNDGSIYFGNSGNVLNTQTAHALQSFWLQWAVVQFENQFIAKSHLLTDNYSASQNAINWGNLGNSSFTPASFADGTFKWLSAIQAPVARLSYVLASQERIEAQQAAAENEEAVVDNFIDSTGDGSASPSDIGSISDLSAGYKDNFGSDASVSGIFNIFNSNNMGWFSQETANQLDTTTPSRRGSSFDTPLLDQQIYDIYDQIGVKHD